MGKCFKGAATTEMIGPQGVQVDEDDIRRPALNSAL